MKKTGRSIIEKERVFFVDYRLEMIDTRTSDLIAYFTPRQKSERVTLSSDSILDIVDAAKDTYNMHWYQRRVVSQFKASLRRGLKKALEDNE